MKSFAPILGLTSILLLNSCGGLPLPGAGPGEGDSGTRTIEITGKRIFSNVKNAQIYGGEDLNVTLTNSANPAAWRISLGEVLAGEAASAVIPYSEINQQELDGVKAVSLSALDAKGAVLLTREVFIDDRAPSIDIAADVDLGTLNAPRVVKATDAGSGVGTFTASCASSDSEPSTCGTVNKAAGTITFNPAELLKKFSAGPLKITLTSQDRMGNAVTQTVTVTLNETSGKGTVKISRNFVTTAD